LSLFHYKGGRGLNDTAEKLDTLLDKVEAVIQENAMLRVHIDTLTVMQAKSLSVQPGISAIFTPDEIQKIKRVSELPLDLLPGQYNLV